ncbi:hypothetical protein Q8A73_012820 [Channa argus]|nr:hypothetical protein Q8A73_012820 [Channa argus]
MVEPYSSVIITYTITNILCLLPFCILVFYHGLQRWQQQRSSSTAEMNTHLDSFTYHLVTMEIISISGWVLCVCGIFGKDVLLLNVGYYLYSVTWYGETFFHVLTCVQHYLAVVHPITYLSLRKHKGIRIRSITIGCIWLLSFGPAEQGQDRDRVHRSKQRAFYTIVAILGVLLSGVASAVSTEHRNISVL